MEGIVVAGVSCDKNEARIALRSVPDVPGVAAKIFTPLSKANIVVDMIIQNQSMDGMTDLTFTVSIIGLSNCRGVDLQLPLFRESEGGKPMPLPPAWQFQAGAGGTAGGSIGLTVPTGWSAPNGTNGTAGTSVSGGAMYNAGSHR